MGSAEAESTRLIMLLNSGMLQSHHWRLENGKSGASLQYREEEALVCHAQLCEVNSKLEISKKFRSDCPRANPRSAAA